METWTETRDALITAGIPADRLPIEWQWRIDLSGAYLTEANLSGANLTEANLSEANLSGANLSGANLSGANLTGAYLSGANLSRANLTGANLTGAYLSGANLTGAYLSGANLTGAYLSGANLSRANLSRAYLSRADLSRADLSRAALNWQSHNLLAEVLRRAAGDDVPRRMLAGLILISHDWCWGKFLALNIDPELREWGLSVMRGYVQPGDNAPLALTAATHEVATPPAA